MHIFEFEKSKTHILAEFVEYVPDSVISKTIIIPAHTINIVKANEKVKIISTVIISGYEKSSI